MTDAEAARIMWPSYALRAWLGALMSQTHRARAELEARIDSTEKELARLRRQHERAGSVIQSLQEATAEVDARLRHIRDSDPEPMAERHGSADVDEPSDMRGREQPEQDRAANGQPKRNPPGAGGKPGGPAPRGGLAD